MKDKCGNLGSRAVSGDFQTLLGLCLLLQAARLLRQKLDKADVNFVLFYLQGFKMTALKSSFEMTLFNQAVT